MTGRPSFVLADMKLNQETFEQAVRGHDVYVRKAMKQQLMDFVEGEYPPSVKLEAIEQLINLLFIEDRKAERKVTKQGKHNRVNMKVKRRYEQSLKQPAATEDLPRVNALGIE